MKKNAQELFRIARTALEGAGAHPRMAEAAAKHLVRAEEQGLATHGLSRVPFYCSMLRNGRADGAAHPAMLAERGGACLIDNRDGLPYVSVEWAVGEAIQRARRNGIGFAGIRNSAHVGVLGIHLLPVAEAGLVGFAFTNSPAAIPPWGGRKALFGTNPVAAVFPRKERDPIVVDLALTTVVRGKIMMSMRQGERIPEGWALDPLLAEAFAERLRAAEARMKDETGAFVPVLFTAHSVPTRTVQPPDVSAGESAGPRLWPGERPGPQPEEGDDDDRIRH